MPKDSAPAALHFFTILYIIASYQTKAEADIGIIDTPQK